MYRNATAVPSQGIDSVTPGARSLSLPCVWNEEVSLAQLDADAEACEAGGRDVNKALGTHPLLTENTAFFTSLAALAVVLVSITAMLWLRSYFLVSDVDSQDSLVQENSNGSRQQDVIAAARQRSSMLGAEGPGALVSVEHEFTRYKLYPREAYLTGAKSFCVLNEDTLTRSRRSAVYDLSRFPYHLCTDAAYCCASLDDNATSFQDPSAWQFRAFPLVKGRNPFAKLWLFIQFRGGVQCIENLINARRADNQQLASRVVGWLKAYGYEAVAFPWKHLCQPEEEVEGESRSIALFRLLKRALSEASLELAVLVDGPEVRGRPEFLRLLDALDDSAVIVKPPPLSSGKRDTAPPFSETFLLYDKEAVDSLVAVRREIRKHGLSRNVPTPWDVCFLVSLAGTALILADSSNGSVGAEAVGPWTGGSIANGWISLDDVCRLTWTTRRAAPYAHVAQSGIFWTATHNLETLSALLTALTNRTKNARRCMGVADPEWDDVGGLCGRAGTRFPLTKTVFDYVTSSALRRTH
ncbi:hypothetical protein V5799_011448 [Amblyomma americanum]|uniref:Transmembrane protein n=1 Tax=Amblyomma americanum TaxID=6943 RepID=A0AAQ4EGV1_AMBAM